jgi:hypothetical protein
MLKIIQSRSWDSFQRCMARIPPTGWLVATPPDLTFASLESNHLKMSPVTATAPKFCIQTNTLAVYDTYVIARTHGQLLLCGTYLINLQTTQIVPTELLEEDGSRTFYLR